MNKVINNRLYDTETATLIATKTHYPCCNNCCECEDYCTKEISLFRKTTGEYFLYMHCSSMEVACEESEIRPISLEEAKVHASILLDGTEYMKLFGVVEE